MSSCATSVAHERRNAEPKIPAPETNAIQRGSSTRPLKCATNHATGSRTTEPIQTTFAIVRRDPRARRRGAGTRRPVTGSEVRPRRVERLREHDGRTVGALLYEVEAAEGRAPLVVVAGDDRLEAREP